MVKREKITQYLRSNYRWTDPEILDMWAGYLDNERFSKIIHQRLVWTSQGSQEMSKYLTGIRKGITPGFRIDLNGLLRMIPNDLIVFQNAKNNPLFPILVLQIYANNRASYDAFRRRHPVLPPEHQLLRLVQQDEHWHDKYMAGVFFQRHIDIQFRTRIPDIQIIFFFSLSDVNPFFKAELKRGHQTLSTIHCPLEDTQDLLHKKLSLLYDLLIHYEYDSRAFLRQINNELQNFTHLVPEFIPQTVSLFVSQHRVNNLTRGYNRTAARIRHGEGLDHILINNLYSWPFRRRPNP